MSEKNRQPGNREVSLEDKASFVALNIGERIKFTYRFTDRNLTVEGCNAGLGYNYHSVNGRKIKVTLVLIQSEEGVNPIKFNLDKVTNIDLAK